MRLSGLVPLVVVLSLSAGSTDSAKADGESYSKTPFYETEAAVTFIAFSPDGTKIAFATEDRTVRIRDTATGSVVASLVVPSTFEGGDDYLHHLAFSPDATRIATTSRDSTVRVWDVAAGETAAVLELPAVAVAVAFSPDGARLATTSVDNLVRLWDADGGLVAELPHRANLVPVAFSPDGARLVTTATEGTARIWEAASGRPVADLAGHSDAIVDARFSPDGTRVITAWADATARLWDAESGRELLVVRHSDPVAAVAFSPDGTRIVTAAGTTGRILDAADGHEIAVLSGLAYPITQVAFSPDGTRMLAGADDGSARLWDAATGEVVSDLLGHSYAISSATFSADGQKIFTVGGGQGIVWAKFVTGTLPEGLTGLWFHDFGTESEPLPAEIVKSLCVATPIKVNGNGTVIFFDGGYGVAPYPALHMRCAADQSCQVFPGGLSDGGEQIGAGTLALTEQAGNLCLMDDCRVVARCPAIEWTDDERASGFVAQWEEAVLGGAN